MKWGVILVRSVRRQKLVYEMGFLVYEMGGNPGKLVYELGGKIELGV